MIFILIFVDNCLKQDAVRIKNSKAKKIAEKNKNNNNY